MNRLSRVLFGAYVGGVVWLGALVVGLVLYDAYEAAVGTGVAVLLLAVAALREALAAEDRVVHADTLRRLGALESAVAVRHRQERQRAEHLIATACCLPAAVSGGTQHEYPCCPDA
ncbi:hypothetical protein G3I76_20120 [Streptomyces sp. SID11233]|uniref:hypothetical protein n=1 Tax=Streptomyces sp. SID11385 TaxID=2706031 RepID=UPI0013BEE282|nr:hypothetical protein [Streptomyces sp. SID11385]NEA42743.1 hypothetical protein [Streptomyces sp. SID11385]NED82390.1 hypothetical protein [Streptomyces sp. SID11233]